MKRNAPIAAATLAACFVLASLAGGTAAGASLHLSGSCASAAACGQRPLAPGALVSLVGGTIHVRENPANVKGTPNHITVREGFAGSEYVIEDTTGAQPIPPCRMDGNLNTVSCDHAYAIDLDSGSLADKVDLVVDFPGAVEVSGGSGDDTINLSSDTFFVPNPYNADATRIFGGPGNDGITATEGARLIDGGEGVDHIRLKKQGGEIDGGEGSDFIYGSADAIRPGPADGTVLDDDHVYAGNGDDYVYGSIGKDTISGGGGYNTLHGGDGNDTLTGGSSDYDDLYGEAGNDTLNAYDHRGGEIVDCGAGNDTAKADRGDRLGSCETLRLHALLSAGLLGKSVGL